MMPGAGPAAVVWKGPKPTVAMKQLQWAKIPANKFTDTVFSKMQADKISLDISSLEQLFCKAEPVKAEAKAEEATPAKIQKVTKVDGKVLQNTSIFLKTLKRDNKEIREVILTLAPDVLNEEMTRKLCDNLPSDEDVNAIKGWLAENPDANKLEDMHEVDQYFMMLDGIPQVRNRLEVWLTHLTYPEKHEKAKTELLKLKTAIYTVKENCENFKRLVEIILAVGNFLNSGGRNGNAPGFFLGRTLDKIQDTKGGDRKTSLLHWIVSFVQDKPEYANVNNWVNDFEQLQFAKDVKLVDVQGDISQMKGELNSAAAKIPGIPKADDKWDVFGARMPDRIAELQKDVESLDKMNSDVTVAFTSLLTDWGEPKQTKTEEFFGMLSNFRDNYDRTDKEIKAQKLKEEKEKKQKELEEKKAAAAKKKEELEARRKLLAQKKAGAAAGGASAAATAAAPTAEQKQAEETAAVEDAFKDVASSVKTGAAFKKRRLRRQDTLREKRKQAAKNAGKDDDDEEEG